MSKGYLLDTNAVSSLVTGLNLNSYKRFELNDTRLQEAQNVLRNYLIHEKDANVFICSVVTGEIEYGMRSAPPNDGLKQQEIFDVLNRFPLVLSLDKHVAAPHYADLRAKLFRKYAPKDIKGRAKSRYVEEWCDPTTGKVLGVNENDVWLAAVAMTYNLALVTADKMNHIKSIAPAQLQVLDWSKDG